MIASNTVMNAAAVECDVRSRLKRVDHATCLPLLKGLGAGESEGSAQELEIHASNSSKVCGLFWMFV